MTSESIGVAHATSATLPSSAGAAPGLSWMDGDGVERSLGTYKGKVVLVNFWATWCPPCRREIPDLIRLRERLGPQGLEVIGVSVSERPDVGTTAQDHVGRYAASVGVTYPLILGNEAVVQAFGGITALPTSFLIGRDGKVAMVIEGARDEQTFDELIQTELKK